MPTATPTMTVNRTIDHARRRSIAMSWVASMRGPVAGHTAGRLDGEGHTTIWWRRDPYGRLELLGQAHSPPAA